MKVLAKQIVAVLLAGAFVGLPAIGSSPASLVGVAQGTGAIQINGQTFEGQASLFSGDRILTGAGSPLTVFSSAAERLRFESQTSATVTKLNKVTVVHLDTGAVDLATSGETSAILPDGISVTPAASTKTLAQVERLTNGNAQVSVYQGRMQVIDADETITVNAGHTAVISPASNAQNNQSQKKHKKKLWAIFIATGINVGITAAILANEQSHVISAIDP